MRKWLKEYRTDTIIVILAVAVVCAAQKTDKDNTIKVNKLTTLSSDSSTMLDTHTLQYPIYNYVFVSDDNTIMTVVSRPNKTDSHVQPPPKRVEINNKYVENMRYEDGKIIIEMKEKP